MSTSDQHIAHAPSTAMKREFTTGSALSMAFVFISPIVAIYSVFGVGLQAVGPGFWWGWVIVFIGQGFVALTLGVLASRWSDAGGVYQWSRRLLGERYGWFAGWTYICALLIALTSVSYSAALFVAALFDLDDTNVALITGIAVGLLALTTALNLAGRIVVKVIAYACVAAELVASIGVGVYLLVFQRHNGPEILFQGLDANATSGAGAFLSAPLVLALVFAGWSALGFESASTLAEEVQNPRRAVPRAIIWSLVLIAGTVLFTGLAFILAIPSPDFLASTDAAADPVLAILAHYLPAEAVKIILAMFVVAFLASLMSIHTAVSRVIWVYGRDRKLPCAHVLGRLRGRQALPVAATLTAGVIPMLLFIPLQSPSIYDVLIAFTVVGFFLAFTFPVLGFTLAKLTGRWTDPTDMPLFLGKWGTPVAWIALLWLLFETGNVLWPRESGNGALADWSSVAATLLIFVIGAVIYLTLKRRSPGFDTSAPTRPVQTDTEESL